MKKWMIYIVLLLTAIAVVLILKRNKHPKQDEAPRPIGLSVHSEKFNTAIDNMMQSYFDLKNALVEYDTVKVKLYAGQMLALLDSIPMEELKLDTAAIAQAAMATKEDIKSNIASLLQQNDLKAMKQDFSSASDMMYPGFFKVINYDGPILFLQHCPMAFGEDQGANWISNSHQIINPYLGKHDTTYGAGMLECGEVMDSLGKSSVSSK